MKTMGNSHTEGLEGFPKSGEFSLNDSRRLGAMHYTSSAVTPFFLRDGRVPKSHLQILDVGCGAGAGCMRLALSNPAAQIVGIDPSSELIEKALESSRKAKIGNVSFQCGSIEDLARDGVGYDYVNCENGLGLEGTPGDALACLKRATYPSGIIRLSVNNATVCQGYLRARVALQLSGGKAENTEEAIRSTRSLYKGLLPTTRLRRETFPKKRGRATALASLIGMDCNAYSLDQTLELLDSVNLGLIAFVDLHRWRLEALFHSRYRNSPQWEKITMLSRLDQYRFVDAVNYNQGKYDFWCTPESQMPQDGSSPTFAIPGRGSLIRLHPVLLRSGLVEATAKSESAGRSVSLERFSPYAASRVDQPWQVQDLITLIGDDEWLYERLLARWRLLRPIRPSDGTSCEAEEVERSLSIGLRYLCSAGIALATRVSGP